MIRSFMQVTEGKTDREKLDAVVSYCQGLPEELNRMFSADNGQRACLPLGTVVLRKNNIGNAGMDYGTWGLLDETVQTSGGKLLIYIRTE